MRWLWSIIAFVACAVPALAEPPPRTGVIHPNRATAVTLARTAAKARDYRVYKVIGLAAHAAPGLTCADPRGVRRLEQRGWNEIPDTLDPPHSDVPPEAAELFNRTLAADKGFQAATGCRALTVCETRFGPAEPDAGNFGGDFGRTYRIDRQCLHQPGQLIAAVRGGSEEDVELLLRRAPQIWRREDQNGRDVYDAALIEAAKRGRSDLLPRLLTRVSTGPAATDAPARSIETALVAALSLGSRRDAGDALVMGRMLRERGARLTYKNGLNVSVLTEVIGQSIPGDAERLKIVDWLLAAGADPNGPPCSLLGGVPRRGLEPLRWALDDEPLFDRLIAAGAQVRDAPCKSDDRAGGMSLTWHATRGLQHLGPGFEERRRVAIKLLKLGGRVGSWSPDPVSVSGANIPALSIVVAAAQLDGVRDEFLRAVIAGSADRPGGEPAAQQARVWLACAHSDPVFRADRALLCDGES